MSRSGRARILLTVAAAASLTAGCEAAGLARGNDEPRVTDALAAADSLHEEERWAEAAQAYAALYDSVAATGDAAALWHVEAYRSDALTELGELDAARQGLDEALRLAEGDSAREARTRYFRSIWYDRQGRFTEAEEEAKRILSLAGSKNRDAERDGLNALGRIYSLSGRYLEALEVHERYLALMRERGTPADVALALNEVGIDYRHFGRFDDAARSYEEALGVFRRDGDAARLAMVQYNLANLRRDMGDRQEAARLYEQALEATEEVGDPRGQTYVLNALGQTYLEADNLPAARADFDRSVEVNRRARFPYGLAVSLLGLGRVELAAGRTGDAEAPLVEALTIADSTGLGRERAAAHAALADLAMQRSDGAGARSHAARSLALADSLRDPAARYEGLAALGSAYEALGQEDRALATFRSGIDLLESWRGRLSMGDLRLGITRPRMEVYEGAIRMLVRRGSADEALDVAERARARLLLDLMSDRSSPTDTVSRRGLLRLSLRDRYAAREDAPPERREAIDAEIEQLGGELAALDAEPANEESGRGASRNPSPISSGAVEAGLGQDRALLEYFWGEKDVWGWAASRSGVRAARLGSPDSLSALVDFLRATIEDPMAEAGWRAAGRRAYRKLVAPLTRQLPGDLWVIPDGPLASLPFEVLIPDDPRIEDGGSGEVEPWGATKRISYGPSASILLALDSEPRRSGWDGDVLAVGNPDLRTVDRELNGAARLAPLPYAEEEARAVSAVFEPGRSALLLGRDASVERWRRRQPERYRYLHFAAHAVVSEVDAGRTYVLFADGPLDLAAIRRTRITADLVTLSACETGLGLPVRGEGVIGLPHAFLAAGARGVVVSLWPVADRSAAEFMTSFYRKLGAGVPPADALRQVRRDFLRRWGSGAHPARWASFVLVGGPRR